MNDSSPIELPVGETTGSFLVTFEPGAVPEAASIIESTVGVESVAATDVAALSAPSEAKAGAAVVFENLGVAVVDAPPARGPGVSALGESDAVMHLEPERILYALGEVEAPTSLAAPDESAVTWGLAAIEATAATLEGQGVTVAVLDTGIDLGHPDLAGRVVASESFIPNEAVQDLHGHGTHCIGTVAGPASPEEGPRYGVAPEADIHAYKVLANSGEGPDRQILAGLDAAVAAGCDVVSMSLGSRTVPGQAPSVAYERAARNALQQGTVVVAAAGNDSKRASGAIAPVSHPANCRSILAVAAVDFQMAVANFSNRGVDPGGGQVDVAGPGVDIYSTAPMPQRYRRLNGTSMATPHVAGVLALLRQADPSASASGLVATLLNGAQRLAAASADVGSGLAQAP